MESCRTINRPQSRCNFGLNFTNNKSVWIILVYTVLVLWLCAQAEAQSSTQPPASGGVSTAAPQSAGSTPSSSDDDFLPRKFQAVYLTPLFVFIFLVFVIVCSYWEMIGFPLKYLK